MCSADPTAPHQSGTPAVIPAHRCVGRELVRGAASGRPLCAATGCGRCPSARRRRKLSESITPAGERKCRQLECMLERWHTGARARTACPPVLGSFTARRSQPANLSNVVPSGHRRVRLEASERRKCDSDSIARNNLAVAAPPVGDHSGQMALMTLVALPGRVRGLLMMARCGSVRQEVLRSCLSNF